MADAKCASCSATDVETVHVRERRPGAKGSMSQSFWAAYYLCPACLKRSRDLGLVEREGKRRRHETAADVRPQTLQYLRCRLVG